MSLLDEMNERYAKMAEEAAALDEKRKVLMLGMNELTPAIWALEAAAAPQTEQQRKSEDAEKAAIYGIKPSRPANPALEAFLLLEGAMEWSGINELGGSFPATIAYDERLEILFFDGSIETGAADLYEWGRAENDVEKYSDIIAYRPIEAAEASTDLLRTDGVDAPKPSPEQNQSPDQTFGQLQGEAQATGANGGQDAEYLVSVDYGNARYTKGFPTEIEAAAHFNLMIESVPRAEVRMTDKAGVLRQHYVPRALIDDTLQYDHELATGATGGPAPTVEQETPIPDAGIHATLSDLDTRTEPPATPVAADGLGARVVEEA